jgi:hypothetical protein
MNNDELMAGLPGEGLVREGLADFTSGRHTVPACLVAMAYSRFQSAGLLASGLSPSWADEPELLLYRLLRQQGADAYSRYNSLVRELVSFESALDRRRRKQTDAK